MKLTYQFVGASVVDGSSEISVDDVSILSWLLVHDPDNERLGVTPVSEISGRCMSGDAISSSSCGSNSDGCGIDGDLKAS